MYKLKRLKRLPPYEITAEVEKLFGPGYRIKWEEWLCVSDRPTWRYCQELYRLEEWARTGIEPPPIGWFTRVIWRIQKRICRDWEPWLEEPTTSAAERQGLAR
jgi:hypothetical protein